MNNFRSNTQTWTLLTVNGNSNTIQGSLFGTLTVNGSSNTIETGGAITTLNLNASNILDARTITTVNIAAGATIQLGGNITTANFNGVGTSGSQITVKSDSSGTQRQLCVTTWQTGAYIVFKDINASCTAFECCSCTDSGDNANISFCGDGAFLLNLL